MFEPPEDPTLGDQVQLTPTRQSQLVVYGSDLQADEVSRGKTQHDKGEHDSFSRYVRIEYMIAGLILSTLLDLQSIPFG